MDYQMITLKGTWIDLSNPQPSDIDVEEIAHSLSQQCRFNGQTPFFYSVAEHSVLVSKMVLQEGYYPLVGLLHDAPEAYIGDISRPIQNLLTDPRSVKVVEERFLRHIFSKFDFDAVELYWISAMSAVKKVDDTVLDYEIEFFFRKSLAVYPVDFKGWLLQEAYGHFMRRLEECVEIGKEYAATIRSG